MALPSFSVRRLCEVREATSQICIVGRPCIVFRHRRLHLTDNEDGSDAGWAGTVAPGDNAAKNVP